MTVIGVNRFVRGTEGANVPLAHLDPTLEAEQCQRLATEKSKRSADEVSENLAELSRLASGDGKLMPQIVSCVEARCTLGEISDTLRAVWGEYQRPMS